MKNKILFVAFCVVCLVFYSACSSSPKKADTDSMEMEIVEEADTDNVGGELDDILTAYDKHVDNFIDLSKKVAGGDITIMQEYLESVEQIGNLTEMMQNVQGMFSTKQMEAFMKIQEKLMNAASEMM